jgi:Holliday junction DNA helicase RuvA
LYGFENKSGQELFVKLRSVKGVGSKTALSILQLGSLEVMDAIKIQDVKFLSKAHGLGKKGAERIILELQNTLPSTLNLSRKHSPISDNIMTGLIGLGYNQKQVKEVLSSLPKNVQKEEDVVKFFLQNV